MRHGFMIESPYERARGLCAYERAWASVGKSQKSHYSRVIALARTREGGHWTVWGELPAWLT